ncbi:hypothetical protein PFAG_04863 [Plasmodium falciparum Santa Lucia]|uniref:Protein kinase domain-containing protein n=3 Tax=Plasmodium falciparum TaxID=5833 RepID=A0A024V1R3_PLAFA|nr:hypothetical protein PFFVO_04413 [Plasmodium falciparum Vietnam Oak-Knoll (FVO)]EUR65211.1 hypothetical protein PFBG_04827 [Plasmodium falciparum 7G8]EUT80221.1 hypothetical protein PFAG_04863 [Plasmodium falciparum Santa Lucia]
MKIKRIQKSNNNPLHSFHIESEQNILKNLIPINTLKENNNKKIIYSYNILDGFKYKIIIKRKTDNINNIYKIVVSLDHPNIIKLIQYAESDYYFISVSEFFSAYMTQYPSLQYMMRTKLEKSFIRKLTPHSFLIKKINNDLVIKLDDIHNIFSMIIKNCHQFLIFIYLFIFIFLLLLVYFLVCGEFPLYYYKKNEKKICISKKLIKYYNNPFNIIIFYLFDRWKNFSYKGRDFIKKILLGNMSSIISLREALDHEWFKENIRQNTYINFEMLRSIYNFWKKNTFKRYILNNLAKLIINEDIYICQSLFFYLDILQQGSIKYEQYFIIMKKLGLLDGDINKTIAFQFFKKVDYNNEGIITKKKLYKFYNLKTKNEINSYAKKKFTFEEFYNYIRKE